MTDGKAWVELVGDLVLARVRGQGSESLILDCQERVVALLRDTECRNILYDALELENASLDLALQQQVLSEQFAEFPRLKVALLVSNTRTAYLGRLAFGSADHRVFYNDMAAALSWLSREGP